MQLNQKQIQHLYLRTGFGISYQEAKRLEGKTAQELFTRILRSSQVIEEATILKQADVLAIMQAMKDATPEERKALRKKNKGTLRSLNTWWLENMYSSKGFLREKMTLFWHDHFACRIANPFLMQQQHNTLRRYSLTNFSKLLHAVAKDPAMLQFLNNQQNRKRSPNENFAREVMELFTLGRGNYTENDIKEAAKAFTGWGFNREGQYIFRQRQHDFGEKTVFGETKKYSGEDILDVLLNNQQTARFITEKLFRYFVSEEIDEGIVSQLANSFYQSDYNTEKLLTEIFIADWFYEERFIGNKIKSPIELIAGICKQFKVTFDTPEAPLFMQKVLGQILFVPPNVAGWPQGKEWIDSSTLMFRMRLTEMLFVGAELQLRAKDSGDVGDVFRGKREFKKFTPKIAWTEVANQFKGNNPQENFEQMKIWLLQTEAASVQPSSKRNKLEQLQENALKITQLPEYQLC